MDTKNNPILRAWQDEEVVFLNILLTGNSLIVRKETLKEPMLNVYLQNKISGIHIMNTAVSGNNSQALRERFAKDVLSYTADKVFILIGTNDLAEHKQLSKETYQKSAVDDSSAEKDYSSDHAFFITPPAVDETKQNIGITS